MIVDAAMEWERFDDGSYISIPIYPRGLDDVRYWRKENCQGDSPIDLDRRVRFQFREDAVLATLRWRAEERD
jgi:hypothetical protein